MLSRVKKGDLVEVISGRDKGKRGEVIAFDCKSDKVRVRGVGMRVKHLKPRAAGAKGKIEKQEAFIPACKVMPICPETDKPCRVRAKHIDGGKKVRVSHRSEKKL